MKSLRAKFSDLRNQAVPYVSRSPNLPLFGRNDMTVQMASMGTVGTLFGVVQRLAEATSQVEWMLYQKAASGLKEDRTPMSRHRALEIWNRPNDFFTRQSFVESFQQHMELTGEGWWIVQYVGPFPYQMWPVRPDRMAPVPSPDKFISGYIYRAPDGERIPFETKEVIQLKMPNPLDPYRGMGPVQSILVDIDSARYSAEWNRNFFLNNAQPGGIIEVPEGTLNDNEFRMLRDRWDEQHHGVNRAHRVAILEGGMQWKDRNFSMRDMQFKELRDASSDIIMQAFGFPKAMLGMVADSNRSNTEAMEYMFSKWLIVSRLERIKQALNTYFLPLFGTNGSGLEFDYESPVPDDVETENDTMTAKVSAYSTLVKAGVSPEDAATTVGLPPMRVQVAPSPENGSQAVLENLAKLVNTLAPNVVGGRVLTWKEGRALLNRGGANLDLEIAPPIDEVPDIENAWKWEAVEHVDEDTCEPCRENNGTMYRNRAAAYEDYPGGEGYVNCEGQHNCRGKVVKRGRKGKGE